MSEFSQLFSITFQGNETTALAVSYAILFMAIHPDVQNRVVEELQQVFYAKDIPIDYEAISQLTYLEMVIKETLRLCPSVPTMARELEEEMIINGHRVPKGSEIIISAYATHRREQDWGPNNETFDPDRFLPENVAARHRYCYLPFSVGSRNCIGK